MAFHRLNQLQQDTLQDYVIDQTVYDLGAGDCSSSVLLAELGAAAIIAVDKVCFPIQHPRVQQLNIRFEELVPDVDSIDVAFISWPNNHFNPNLLALIRISQIVIYQGSNTGGNACGHPIYFEELRHRKVLEYVPDRRNTLIIYGETLTEPRTFAELHGEEVAGWTMLEQTRILSFEETESKFPIS